MTNKLAEIYIRESDEAQTRESREAFEFIDKQVKEYGEKLATYHQQVLGAVWRSDSEARRRPLEARREHRRGCGRCAEARGAPGGEPRGGKNGRRRAAR